jgi:hypothetical protein
MHSCSENERRERIGTRKRKEKKIKKKLHIGAGLRFTLIPVDYIHRC